jgi:hypothetical protein
VIVGSAGHIASGMPAAESADASAPGSPGARGSGSQVIAWELWQATAAEGSGDGES